MPLKWKILMPVVSVATAGGISYPYLSSGDGTGVSRSNSVLMNLDNPTFKGNRSLSDINSGKASSLSVSPIDSSKGLSLEIQSDSPGLNLDPKGEIMQTNALPIKGIQSELDKESKVGELTEEQIKELKDAFEYVKGAKQAFVGLMDKVREYRKTSASQGDTSSTRTFLESGEQVLTRHHRESLMKFFEMYSKLEKYKSNNLSRLVDIEKGDLEMIGFDRENTLQSRKILDNLKKIEWDKKDIIIVKDRHDEKNWGWGEWKENPFKSFYKKKNIWILKTVRIKDAEDISRINKKDSLTCSSNLSSTNTERDQAIQAWCDKDSDRFTQLVEGYKSEIELDIASWLLDQMQVILKE